VCVHLLKEGGALLVDEVAADEMVLVADVELAGVGFVPRVGVRSTKLHINRTPRPGRWGIRVMTPMWHIVYTTDQAGRLLYRELHHMIRFTFENNADFTVVYNRNFERLDPPIRFPGDTTEYAYRYWVDGLMNGWQYVFAVTAYDRGDPAQNLLPLESSARQTSVRSFPGAEPNDGFARGKVGVYPNPYYVRAAWDGSAERDKKIYFTNLPSECEIHIYTLAGETVDVLYHSATDQSTSGIRWYTTYGGDPMEFSGGEAAWDLISQADQRLATGLYLFAVKDLKTGDIQQGKFVVIR